ncbi:uncharacterized protein [Physcomitrium patens]|uniref:uncharacterized protein n=1 Tax=Physcomitrium patens TaxID=3218 RepID=UPI000D1690CD|nr:uncharacterized protein LOC112280640 [Physcomitrium patens]|eukprot:XP_024372102.1 uncharacterized protein LOC112280640 [Physcomitrella patens]
MIYESIKTDKYESDCNSTLKMNYIGFWVLEMKVICCVTVDVSTKWSRGVVGSFGDRITTGDRDFKELYFGANIRRVTMEAVKALRATNRRSRVVEVMAVIR